MDTEDHKFAPHAVWQAAWARFERKVLSKLESVRTDILRAQSRGDASPNMTTRGACMEPLASFTDLLGDLKWNKDLVDRIKKLAEPPPKTKSKKKQPSPP